MSIEFHEALAWFSLGRRFVALHMACGSPPDPIEARRSRLDGVLELARMLSLPVPNGIAIATRSPKRFDAEAKNLYANLVTATVIARGEQAAKLLQTGAAYFTVVALPDGADVAKGFGQIESVMKECGVAADKRRALLKRTKELHRKDQVTGDVEGKLANDLGNALATAVSKSSGIKVGETVIPNSILLPSKYQVVLPKKLVGYRSEIEKFLRKHPFERNVFLMMPFREATTGLRTRIRAVCGKYSLHLVVADEQRIIENDLNSNVLACLLSSKYGIAVFSKPESKHTFNPNVAYEIGMMHRDDKVCLILKDRQLKALPSDLISYLYVEYSPRDTQSVVSQVETWILDRIL